MDREYLDPFGEEDWDEQEDELHELKNDIRQCFNDCYLMLPTDMKKILDNVCENYKDSNVISEYRVEFPKRNNENFNIVDIYLKPYNKVETLVLNVSIIPNESN